MGLLRNKRSLFNPRVASCQCQTPNAKNTQASCNAKQDQPNSVALMMKYLTTLLSCVILFSPSLVSAKKLAKIKAGKTYADKDEVHVVVNSVG